MAEFKENLGELVPVVKTGEGIPPAQIGGYDMNMYYSIDYIPWSIRQQTLTPPYNTYPQTWEQRIPLNNEYFINWTDTIVLWDPSFQVQIYKKESETHAGGNISGSSDVDSKKNDAINYPLIRINGTVIIEEQLEYVEINVNNILPTITLKIYDENKVIRRTNGPSWNNTIKVIIANQLDGIYKNSNFNFYIESMEEDNEFVIYKGIYKIEGFNDSIYTGLTMPSEIQAPGKIVFDPTVHCPLSTFETCALIAKKYGLGFAYTCYNRKRTEYDGIERPHYQEDYRWRIVKHTTIYNFMKELLDCAGDPTHIYDIWVDMFGYLTIVDIAYLYKVVETGELQDSDLAIWAVSGVRSNMEDGAEYKAYRMQRTLSNTQVEDIDYNLKFTDFEVINQNKVIFEDGTETINTSLGNLNNNEITTNNAGLQIKSNNPQDENDGKYSFAKHNFLGFEFINEQPSVGITACGVCSPYTGQHLISTPHRVPISLSIPYQKDINTKFFNKIRTKILRIKMDKYNIGLQRGQIINVIFKEYEQQMQKHINPDHKYNDTGKGVLNPYLTAHYYIDSTQYVYSRESKKIDQYLYLINLEQIHMNPNNK